MTMLIKPADIQHRDQYFGKIFPGSLILLVLFVSGCSPRDSSAIDIQPSNTSQAAATYVPLPTRTSTPIPTPIPPTFTPTLDIGATLIADKDGMTLVYVPAGEFTTGSESYDHEQPIHTVYLDAFWIDQTEVTNKQYAMCVSDGDCVLPLSFKSPMRSSYYDDPPFDNYPVIYVEWHMAAMYCQWAGRRLPTEAEWEKAARSDDGRIYPWGNTPPNDDLLNYNSPVRDTTEVGKYPNGQSPYGAYDMAGNVWEWLSDWYDGNYYQKSPASNPRGPEVGEVRAVRGGGWYYQEGSVVSIFRYGVVPVDYLVRSDVRSFAHPTFAETSIYGRQPFGTLGFRCAMSAIP